MSAATFDQVLRWTLHWEGGYVDNLHDAGGATNRGITQRTYDAYRRSKNLPTQSVQHISALEVHVIYQTGFWVPSYAYLFEYPLAQVLFDTFVQFNPATFWSFVHQACQLGEQHTLHELLDYMQQHQQAVAQSICDLRVQFRYERVKKDESQHEFLQGWLNRDEALRRAVSSTQEHNQMEPHVFDPHVVGGLIDSVNNSEDRELIIALIHTAMTHKGVQLEDVDALHKFFAREAVPMVDVQQIIAIAKTVCKVVGVLDTQVCPFVNQLPG